MRFLLVILCGVAFGQSPQTACAPAAPIAKEVQALPAMADLSRTWEERMAPRRALARKYPSDWALQFLLQDAIRRQLFQSREWDQAFAFYRSVPDRNLGELLEARLLSSLQRKPSKDIIDRALAATPDSPWVHLVAAEWAMHPVSGADPVLAERSFEAVRRMCPDLLQAFRSLDAVKDTDKMARHIRDLRRLLDASKVGTPVNDEDIPLFRTLWTWEKITLGNTDEFEKRVRSDVAYLRTRRLFDSLHIYSTVQGAFQGFLKDPAALKALEQQALEESPKSEAASSILRQRFFERRPPASPLEQVQEHLARFEQFYDRPAARMDAMMLLSNAAAKLSKENVDRIGKFVLRNAEEYPDVGSSFLPYSLQVADAYTRYGVNLREVPALVAKGVEEASLQEKYRRDSDVLRSMPGRVDNERIAQERAQIVLTRLAIVVGEKEKAAQLLANLRSDLERTHPAGNKDGQWGLRHHYYLELMKLAGMEPKPIAELPPTSLENSERFAVADFAAKDLSGKTWRLADLKGKVALVSVWTTWCGPCRTEMPLLQKLHERWKDNPDRVILSISADLHPAVAEQFIKDGKYTFPVIVGKDVADKFFPAVYFPQNWLIDPQGRRVDYRLAVPDEAGVARLEELAARLETR